MMSRMETTSSPAMTITEARIQKSASAQSWPSTTSISAATPKTTPMTARAARIGMSLASTSQLLVAARTQRSNGAVPAVLTAMVMTDMPRMTIPVAAGRHTGDRRGQHRQHPGRIDEPTFGRGS